MARPQRARCGAAVPACCCRAAVHPGPTGRVPARLHLFPIAVWPRRPSGFGPAARPCRGGRRRISERRSRPCCAARLFMKTKIETSAKRSAMSGSDRIYFLCSLKKTPPSHEGARAPPVAHSCGPGATPCLVPEGIGNGRTATTSNGTTRRPGTPGASNARDTGLAPLRSRAGTGPRSHALSEQGAPAKDVADDDGGLLPFAPSPVIYLGAKRMLADLTACAKATRAAPMGLLSEAARRLGEAMGVRWPVLRGCFGRHSRRNLPC